MKVVQASSEILKMDRGEEALWLLELIGRKAYKSEGLIDHGREGCRKCGGTETTPGKGCLHCVGKGWIIVREPSSHRFICKILRASRRDELHERAVATLNTSVEGEQVARNIVDMVLDNIENDPPHLGVIEHCSATVLFISNRGFTHELVRHRVASYLQESTRYCNYSKGKFGTEITTTERPEFNGGDDVSRFLDLWMKSIEQIEVAYMDLVNDGVKPEIARDLLPQVTKAEIVCTANFAEWRHIFRLRCSNRAHPDMRRLMTPLRDQFRRAVPIIFDPF